ncbi:MAG: class I SAM-dependent DNA methyltransferase [Thermoplasmatota archaeon]
MAGADRMYRDLADLYDALYGAKDYSAEARRLQRIIKSATGRNAGTLLDVACGTGRHLEALVRSFRATGVDRNGAMLAIARKRLRGHSVRLVQQDMRSLDLGIQFDAVTCLFGSIAYVRTIPALRRTVHRLAGHMKPDGVLIIEGFLDRENFRPGTIRLNVAETDDLKLARLGITKLRSQSRGRIEFHTLVGRHGEIRYEADYHDVGIFSRSEIADAMRAAGLRTQTLVAPGERGKGTLFVGRPKSST